MKWATANDVGGEGEMGAVLFKGSPIRPNCNPVSSRMPTKMKSFLHQKY